MRLLPPGNSTQKEQEMMMTPKSMQTKGSRERLQSKR